ncbi:MAG: hypothetical protein HW375_901 [Anaerolineales bacterium]|nr:hypothetical protein [Anaerolineales bacterium]
MTEDYSRPATLDDVKALIRALNAQNADYLLIGGYALFAHGYHRSTTGIDVLVPANREAENRRLLPCLIRRSGRGPGTRRGHFSDLRTWPLPDLPAAGYFSGTTSQRSPRSPRSGRRGQPCR